MVSIVSMPTERVAAPHTQWGKVVAEFSASKAKETPMTLPFICWIQLATNISSHRISLYVMDGRLRIQRVDRSLMENYDFKAVKSEQKLSTSLARARMMTPSPSEVSTGSRPLDDTGKVIERVSVYLGHISMHFPKPLELVLTNTNPLSTPLRLKQSTVETNACLVHIDEISRPDDSFANLGDL
jgi:hypothetical protein